ncbi:MAG: hypothetical protein EBW76_08165, partial [Actinobacteria bacterium]|nr:hypothetical protein [Actinomycetota bacterium]
ADEIAATKIELGLDPAKSFDVPDDVLNHVRKVKIRGAEMKSAWQKIFSAWQSQNSERSALLKRLMSQELPSNWEKSLPHFPSTAQSSKEIATRKASGDTLQALAAILPELWGGSADLAESNNTTIEGGGSFLPKNSLMKNADPYGRIIHFGIREHAMGAILNGAALHGLVKPFAGTFLVFSDYMRGAVRLSALMQLPVTYVWTHDSIGLGEDGPTHQPVEHLAALRTIPGLDVVRPADANEVSACWVEIIKRGKPAGIALSRQNLPVIDRDIYESTSGVKHGAYVLSHADSSDQNNCQVILIATGSEVYLALSAQEALLSMGIKARVVSAPCLEWFMEQPVSYREQVLPSSVKVPQLDSLSAWARSNNLNQVILCGMGGSSLAPEVISSTYKKGLIVIDSTYPGQILHSLPKTLKNSVIVISSKSGTTIETISHLKLFVSLLENENLKARDHLVIITDPGTELEKTAKSSGYRVINADPQVGGRFSALSAFGLVPAALLGIDISVLLDDAEELSTSFSKAESPAIVLAAL